MNHTPRPQCTFDTNAFIAGDMHPSQRAEFEQHLLRCPRCRAELEDLRLILGALPAREVSISEIDTRRMRARVMTRVRQQRVWRPALAASACAAVALVALISYPASRPAAQAEHAELLGNLEMLQDFEMLQSLDLLEELELLQALENQG